MPNTIDYATVFNSALDQLISQEATTSWMEANASRVKYNGGNEFKLAKIALDGLSDYDRATGFETGSVTFEWETKKFKYDRGRKFRIDAMDTDETNFVLNASTVLGEFVRTEAVPEIDRVRIAELAQNGNAIPANAKGAIETLKDAIVKIRDLGYSGQLVAHVTYDFLRGLETLLAGQLGTIVVNGITFPALESVALIPTVSDRMVSKVEKNESKALVKASDADDLSLIITGVNVPLGINKHNPMKVITPQNNQEADAYDIHYRLYHTLEVEDNKKPTVVYVVDTPVVED